MSTAGTENRASADQGESVVEPPAEPWLADRTSRLAALLPSEFHVWYWALIPLLAVLAYATVLRIGFLGDDYILLFEASTHPVTAQSLLPVSYATFYRPLGSLFVWQFGWYLWGYNPLPFHIQGLILHAAIALVFGLWAAHITSRPSLGWLAGALFAVFPLSLEAVGWIAAQWDEIAVLLGLGSLWAFTVWWRKYALGAGAQPAYAAIVRGSGLYASSLLLYTLGLFTKESLIGWLPVLPASAWFITPQMDARRRRLLAFSIIPFLIPLLLNVGLRLLTWGNLGGYKVSTDYPTLIWDAFINYAKMLVAPVKATLLGGATEQIVGLISSLVLLALLVRYGRREQRLLVLAGIWIFLALVPVLNYPTNVNDLANNRYLYLASGGYLLAVAGLLHATISAARLCARFATGLGVGLAMLACCALCSVQLRPWHTETVQDAEIGQELHRAIPPQTHPDGLVWKVENAPFVLGFDRLRYFLDGEVLQLKTVQSAVEAQPTLASEKRDAFALRFALNRAENRYHLSYAAGITSETPPPDSTEGSTGLHVWDFTECATNAVQEWQTVNAEPECVQGHGLWLNKPENDAQLVGPALDLDPAGSGARLLRLRVQALYPANGPGQGDGQTVVQWYWETRGSQWAEEQSVSMLARQDSKPHVYWLFVPVSQLGGTINRIRFDPANTATQAQIEWIAVDLIK